MNRGEKADSNSHHSTPIRTFAFAKPGYQDNRRWYKESERRTAQKKYSQVTMNLWITAYIVNHGEPAYDVTVSTPKSQLEHPN